MASKKPKKSEVEKPAMAIQLQHEDGVHVVGLGNIRVLLIPDHGDGWFAQGLEIDYGAQGDTIEEAKTEFEEGLVATVHEHLKVHGHIGSLLCVAPDEMWQLANDPTVELKSYSQVTTHHVIQEHSHYEGIAYLVAAKSAGASQ